MDKLLSKLLMMHGNETNFLSTEGKKNFDLLLIELFKTKYDIRWCAKSDCSCHPENQIKKILLDEDLKQFLENERLLTLINDIINNTDRKVTVFDKYGVM